MVKDEEGVLAIDLGIDRLISKFAGITKNLMERLTNRSRKLFTSHLPLFSRMKM